MVNYFAEIGSISSTDVKSETKYFVGVNYYMTLEYGHGSTLCPYRLLLFM